MTTWIKDANGNKCSVEYFGSEEKAQEALDSLVDCTSCSNCADCTSCTNCTGCSNCTSCSNCADCTDCTDCTSCTDCTNCTSCSNCADCTDCTSCSNCTGCSNCTSCSNCAGCSNCSNKKQEWDAPIIENIHQKVYEAVTSSDDALDMDNWHTCETTHCRAGWVVHLAGKEGYALEKKTNTSFTAMMIYKASGYKINPAKFYVDNKEALADMKHLALGETPAKRAKRLNLQMIG